VRIGVNARRLEGQRLGVGRYIEYLVKHWGTMLNGQDEIVLYLREPPRPNDVFPDAITTKVLGPRLTGLAWEAAHLPRAARDVDVLFCPGYSRPPVFPKPTVVAIHSANEAQAGTHPWWYRLTYSPLFKRSARAAERVIVPSRSTLEDVRTLYDIPPERLVAVPLGVDDAFAPTSDRARCDEVRMRYVGMDRPFILFVGKLSQRRNIPTLVTAFAEVKRRTGMPHVLLLFGPNHLGIPLRRLAEEAGVEDAVVQVDGRVESHADLALLYNAADLYVNPSVYEGFSLPLVEALASGTPSVVARRAALAEIADGAAAFVDEPEDPLALADTIEDVLTDESLRAELSRKGVKRARAFRWEDTARRTLDVLQEAASRGAK